MKLLFFNSLLIFCVITNVKCQEKLKLKINTELSVEDIFSMSLYKYDKQNNCDQSRSVKIIYKDTISICFDFVKKIDVFSAKKIFTLLNEKSTYGNENYACFDTDYGLVIHDKNDYIVGSIEISLDCNKAYTNPKAEAFLYYRDVPFYPIGLSALARKKLLGYCKIKDDKKPNWQITKTVYKKK